MNDIKRKLKSENIGVNRCPSVVKDSLTEKIIACVYTVSNTLGDGFLEKVYHNALAHALSKSGLRVETEKEFKVLFDGAVVGDYFADIVVEEQVIVEVKAIRSLDNVNFAQCINYLKASGLKTCLLVNFGTPRVQIKRISN